jgi:hypothetical protein
MTKRFKCTPAVYDAAHEETMKQIHSTWIITSDKLPLDEDGRVTAVAVNEVFASELSARGAEEII